MNLQDLGCEPVEMLSKPVVEQFILSEGIQAGVFYSVSLNRMNSTKFLKPELGNPPILINAQKASRMLAICPRKLWQMTKDRQIPFLKIGKSVRYRVADLDRWTQQQAIPQTVGTET